MKKLHERKKIKKILFSKVSFMIALVIIIILLRGVWGAYAKYSHSQRNLDQAQSELTEMKEKEKELREEIEYIQTDVGKDAVIVEKFNVAKEGERVIVVTQDTEMVATTTQESTSWFTRLIKKVTNLF